MAELAPGKKLKDLRVSDLKVELDKRGLPTSGVKAVLAERLQKQLEEDGHDPDVFDFSLIEEDKKEGEAKDADANELAKGHEIEEDLEKDELEVKDTEIRCSTSEQEAMAQVNEQAVTESAETLDNLNVAAVEVPKCKEPETQSIENVKDETKADMEHKPVGETNPGEEDSINLMIGEDEENLMYDDEQENKNGNASSPPRPENAPVINPFTSRDTISMGASRTNNAPSDNSSMLVHIDESESVGTQGSAEGISTKDEDKQNGEESEKSSEADKKEGLSAASSTIGDKVGDSKTEDKQPSSGLNLWVSGLASSTRATDLKTAFSKHGKVVGAKVVTNARTPGARCYGYVSMGSTEDADKCIQELHKTELHGRVILVERARADSSGPPRTIMKDEKSRKEESPNSNKSEDKAKEGSSNRDETMAVDKEASCSKSNDADGESAKREEEKKRDENRRNSRERSNNTEGRLDRDRREQKRREEERERERQRDRDRDRDRRPRSPPRGREHADLRGRIQSRDRSPTRRNYVPDARRDIPGGGERDRIDRRNRGNNTSPPRRRSPPRDRRSPNSNMELSPRRPDRPDPGRPGILTFQQIREQQQREKDRENERRRRVRDRQLQLIEEERRRKEEERRRAEEERLHRERDELRREREKLEREKQELMKFERERQRLERERLQREKEELERLRRQQQTRLEEARRATKRPPPIEGRDPYYDDRKRSIPDPNEGAGPSSAGARGYDNNSRVGGGFDNRTAGTGNSYGSGGPNIQKSDNPRDHRQHGGRDSRGGRGGYSGGRSGGGNDYGPRGGQSDRDHRGGSSSSGGGNQGGHGPHGAGRGNFPWSSTSTSSHGGTGAPSGSNAPGGRGTSLLGGGPSTSNSGIQGSSTWGRSGPSAPRPPILSQPPNIGVSPFGSGGNMPGGGNNSGGFGNNQSSYSSSDRFDAYKPMMNQKRY